MQCTKLRSPDPPLPIRLEHFGLWKWLELCGILEHLNPRKQLELLELHEHLEQLKPREQLKLLELRELLSLLERHERERLEREKRQAVTAQLRSTGVSLPITAWSAIISLLKAMRTRGLTAALLELLLVLSHSDVVLWSLLANQFAELLIQVWSHPSQSHHPSYLPILLGQAASARRCGSQW